MKITCPHCGRNFEVDDVNAGREADCMNCGKRFVFQADAEPVSPAAANSACPYCGEGMVRAGKTKNPVVFVLLALFLGNFGIHNFYVGDKIRGMSKLIIEAAAVLFFFGFVIQKMLFAGSFFKVGVIVGSVSSFINLILLLVLWARSYRLSDGSFLRAVFVSVFALYTLAEVAASVLSVDEYGISVIGNFIVATQIPASLSLTVAAWCVWEMFHCADACKDAK